MSFLWSQTHICAHHLSFLWSQAHICAPHLFKQPEEITQWKPPAVENEGFKRTQREGIVIAVKENAVVEVALAVGAVSETVTIEGGANLV